MSLVGSYTTSVCLHFVTAPVVQMPRKRPTTLFLDLTEAMLQIEHQSKPTASAVSSSCFCGACGVPAEPKLLDLENGELEHCDDE